MHSLAIGYISARMNGHQVSQPDFQVLPHDLVQADFAVFQLRIHQGNAHSIAALFALDSDDLNRTRVFYCLDKVDSVVSDTVNVKLYLNREIYIRIL